MTDSTHGLALVRRAAAEHRRLIISLGVAVLINVALYAFVVAPLANRVANVAERDRTSEQELARARAEHEQASGVLTGKSRASTELTTFYSEVLPRDLTGARRLTYLRLAQLARESDLEYRRATYAHITAKGQEALDRAAPIHLAKVDAYLQQHLSEEELDRRRDDNDLVETVLRAGLEEKRDLGDTDRRRV